MKLLLYHHDTAASSETAEWQQTTIQEAKRTHYLILSYAGSAGLTRQKAVNILAIEGNSYQWK